MQSRAFTDLRCTAIKIRLLTNIFNGDHNKVADQCWNWKYIIFPSDQVDFSSSPIGFLFVIKWISSPYQLDFFNRDHRKAANQCWNCKYIKQKSWCSTHLFLTQETIRDTQSWCWWWWRHPVNEKGNFHPATRIPNSFFLLAVALSKMVGWIAV